jgi:hypothetical protein
MNTVMDTQLAATGPFKRVDAAHRALQRIEDAFAAAEPASRSALESEYDATFDAMTAGMSEAEANEFRTLSIEGSIDRLVERIRALEGALAELRSRPAPSLIDSDQGVFEKGRAYMRGHLATWDGSTWLAARDTASVPGADDSWRLLAKRGRDGRDRRK